MRQRATGQRGRFLVGAAGVAVLGSAFLTAQAPLAHAACAQSTAAEMLATGVNCCVVTNYGLTATDTRIPFRGIPTFKNGPGPMTMTVTKSYSGTATYQVSAGAESEVGAILAKAKVSISASLSKSNTTTATNSATLPLSAGQYGNMQYVSWGKDVRWAKIRTNASCSTTTLASGRI